MTKTDIFNFNHIEKSIRPDKLDEIKSLYKFYHKTFCRYRQAFKYFKRLNMTVNLTSTSLIVCRTIAGAVTLNPAVLASISGAGLLLKTFSEIKNYKKEIEMAKFAHTTYENVLITFY